MKAILIAAASALILAARAEDPVETSHREWIGAPLGIVITECNVYKDCIRVSFKTDLQPPFVASVNMTSGSSIYNVYPLAQAETMTTNACIPGNFLDASVYVAVETRANIEMHDAEMERIMRERAGDRPVPYSEIEKYRRRTMERIERYRSIKYFIDGTPYVNTNANITLEVKPRNDDVMYLVADHTWVGFKTTSERDVTFNMKGRFFNRDTEETEEYSFPVSIQGGNPDVGTGYRFVFFDDTGVVQVNRAYSARTNMSDFVHFPRAVKSLSACNGLRYTTDWNGSPYLQPTTNDPWIIHWEGIKE